MKSPEAMQELMASSFGRPLPSPGKAVQIRTMVGKNAYLYLVL